jgi:drug/metabolite transporter (DMT)-like permease
VSVALGLIVALSFGSADFLGGRASRHAPTISVLLVSQIVAVVGALIVAAAVGATVHPSDVGLGAAAGVANVVGLGFLYQGLARARIGVVAPITAVTGSLVPVGWALARGERPSHVVLVGVGCAVLAGALIARERSAADADRPVASGVGYALAAGTALGSSLVLYNETSHGSGFWPIVAARLSGLVVVLLCIAALAVWARRRTPANVTVAPGAPGERGRLGPTVLPPGRAGRLAMGAGALDVTATSVLLVAIRHGLLVVVAPVAALAPAFTVVWAWVVLREPVSRLQLAGLALALVGLALIATG